MAFTDDDRRQLRHTAEMVGSLAMGLVDVKRLLLSILMKEGKTMAKLDDVIADINSLTDVSAGIDAGVTAAVDELTRIRALLADAGQDPAKLDAAIQAVDAAKAALDANRQRLADAVANNTPAATP